MPNQQEQTPESGRLSLLFDQETLAQGIRVRPAQFARMCNVSRQTVSQWVKRGLVRLFPDGLLDPAAAAKMVIQNTDPARLRARIFKDATKSVDDWKREATDVRAELRLAKARIQYLEGFLEESELVEELFTSALVEAIDRLAAAPIADLRALLAEIYDDCVIDAALALGRPAPD